MDLEKGEGQLLLLGAAGGGAVGGKALKASSTSAGMQPSPAAPDCARQSSEELPCSNRNSTDGDSGRGSPHDLQRSSPAGDSAGSLELEEGQPSATMAAAAAAIPSAMGAPAAVAPP